MKLQFKAFQENCELTLSTSIDSTSKNKIAGTLLNELFAWVNLQKEVRAKGLKLSEPIGLQFKLGKYNFDSTKIDMKLQQTLKLQSTADGMKRFAKKFWSILEYVTQTRETITFEALITELEKQITE